VFRESIFPKRKQTKTKMRKKKHDWREKKNEITDCALEQRDGLKNRRA
jgi:hypothetical protein